MTTGQSANRELKRRKFRDLFLLTFAASGTIIEVSGIFGILPLTAIIVGGGIFVVALTADRLSYIVFGLKDANQKPAYMVRIIACVWVGWISMVFGIMSGAVPVMIASIGPSLSAWLVGALFYTRANARRIPI